MTKIERRDEVMVFVGQFPLRAPRRDEGVRRGGTLVSARVPDADRTRLDAVLNKSAVNLRDRSAAWQKSGWTAFDPASKPYGADEVRKERQLHSSEIIILQAILVSAWFLPIPAVYAPP